MQKIVFIIIFALISPATVAQYAVNDLKALQALKGSWESERKKGKLVERWDIVNDSTMHGYSYIRSGTDSIPEEKVELLLRHGKIMYIAAAAGQNDDKPVPFTLYKIESRTYYFENRSHDFPQLITYQLVNDTTLKAAIYGPMNGKDVKVTFDFTSIQ